MHVAVGGREDDDSQRSLPDQAAKRPVGRGDMRVIARKLAARLRLSRATDRDIRGQDEQAGVPIETPGGRRVIGRMRGFEAHDAEPGSH